MNLVGEISYKLGLHVFCQHLGCKLAILEFECTLNKNVEVTDSILSIKS